jgi:hypothetical protein
MNLFWATWLVRVFYAYFAVGVVLLPWWHWRGLARLDSAAGAGPWGFRLLISPGLIALWPWLLARGFTGSGHPPTESNRHRALAKEGAL